MGSWGWDLQRGGVRAVTPVLSDPGKQDALAGTPGWKVPPERVCLTLETRAKGRAPGAPRGDRPAMRARPDAAGTAEQGQRGLRAASGPGHRGQTPPHGAPLPGSSQGRGRPGEAVGSQQRWRPRSSPNSPPHPALRAGGGTRRPAWAAHTRARSPVLEAGPSSRPPPVPPGPPLGGRRPSPPASWRGCPSARVCLIASPQVTTHWGLGPMG